MRVYLTTDDKDRVAYVVDGKTGPFAAQVSGLVIWSSGAAHKAAYMRTNAHGESAIVYPSGAIRVHCANPTFEAGLVG